MNFIRKIFNWPTKSTPTTTEDQTVDFPRTYFSDKALKGSRLSEPKSDKIDDESNTPQSSFLHNAICSDNLQSSKVHVNRTCRRSRDSKCQPDIYVREGNFRYPLHHYESASIDKIGDDVTSTAEHDPDKYTGEGHKENTNNLLCIKSHKLDDDQNYSVRKHLNQHYKTLPESDRDIGIADKYLRNIHIGRDTISAPAQIKSYNDRESVSLERKTTNSFSEVKEMNDTGDIKSHSLNLTEKRNVPTIRENILKTNFPSIPSRDCSLVDVGIGSNPNDHTKTEVICTKECNKIKENIDLPPKYSGKTSTEVGFGIKEDNGNALIIVQKTNPDFSSNQSTFKMQTRISNEKATPENYHLTKNLSGSNVLNSDLISKSVKNIQARSGDDTDNSQRDYKAHIFATEVHESNNEHLVSGKHKILSKKSSNTIIEMERTTFESTDSITLSETVGTKGDTRQQRSTDTPLQSKTEISEDLVLTVQDSSDKHMQCRDRVTSRYKYYDRLGLSCISVDNARHEHNSKTQMSDRKSNELTSKDETTLRKYKTEEENNDVLESRKYNIQTDSQNRKGIVEVNTIRSEISKSNPFTHISKTNKFESMTSDHNTVNVRPSNSYNDTSVTTGQNNNIKEDNKMCKDISTSKSIKEISCATKVSTPISSINEMRSEHKERMFSEYNISGSNKIENTSCTTDSKHTENLPEPKTETSTVAVSSFSRQSRACKPNFECLKFTTDDIRNVDITKQDKSKDNRNNHTLQHVERKTCVDKAINQKTSADHDLDKYIAQVKRAIQHEQVNSLSSNNKNNIKQKSEKTESDSKEIDPRRINLLTPATVKTSNWLPVESPPLTFAAQTVNKTERNSVKTSTVDSNFSVIERKKVTENSDLKQRNVASGYKSKTENTQISTEINLKYKRDKLDSQTTKPAVEGSLTKLKDFRRKSDRHGFEIDSNEDQNITEIIIHRQSESKIYPRTESLAIKSVPDNLPHEKMLQSENASYDDKEVESLYTWNREKNASSKDRTCQKLKCINTSKNFTSTVKPTTIAYDVTNNHAENNKYGTEQGTSKDIPTDHSTGQIGNNFNKTLFGARKKDCFVEIDTQITTRNEHQHELIPSNNNGSIEKIESKKIIKEKDFCSIVAIESDENQCFVQSVKDGCEKCIDQKSKTINQGYNMESKDTALLSIAKPIDKLRKKQTKQKDTGLVSEVSCIQSVDVQESKDTEENNSIKTNKKRRSNSKTLVKEISQSESATSKHNNVRCDIKSTDLDEATRSKNVQSKHQTSPKDKEEHRKQEPIKNTPRQDGTIVTDTTGTNIHTNLHKDLKGKGEASKATNGKCPGKEKSESKGLPQVLKIRINNTQADIDVDQLLKQRLNHRYRFRITEVRKEPVFEVLVEFPSRNASRQAKTILCNSNAKFKIKVYCSIDIEKKRETQQEAANRRLSAFVGKLADTARVALVKHEDEIQDISSSLEKFTEKRPRFQSLKEFNKTKTEKEALLSKEIEMKKQEAEFKLFLTSLYDKLQNIQDASFCENDLFKLETAFAIEHSRFTTRLPIYASRTDILRTITENQTSIILGETGSGKSTQVVQYLHQTGRFSNGFIVCTQPRKVAAISLATRVAHEMVSQVGHLVGYHLGMHSKKSTETQILYMTDHILLNECLRDPLLSSFSCVIIDEAHERSIFTDLLLGMIKKCLPNRPDLRVVVTSATIDPDVFVRFFGGCPILSVSGRTFPVDILWSDDDIDDNYEERALKKAIEVHKKRIKGTF